MHGSFLFICGLALGFVFRSRSLKAPLQSAPPTWNDVPWSEITRMDGDAAFSPQLVNLRHALTPGLSVCGGKGCREKRSACVKRRIGAL